MNKTVMVLLITILTACSSKATYDNIRLHERRECLKEASSDYTECIEQTGKSYKEYERERNGSE